MKLVPAGIIGKINPKELGYLCPNGVINFQTEESAIKYAKCAIVKELKATGKELGVITKDSRVLKSIQGDEERILMPLNDIPDIRGCAYHHGHPDFYKGIASSFSPRDAKSFLILNKVLGYNKYCVYNQLGEECSMEFKPSRVFDFLPRNLRYLLFQLNPLTSIKFSNIDRATHKFEKGADVKSYLRKIPPEDIKVYKHIATNGSQKDKKDLNDLLIAKFKASLGHQATRDFAPKIGADYKTNFSYIVD